MSRGRGGSSASGVRAVASALGIARQDISAFTRVNTEPPPLYPTFGQQVLPLNETSELLFMVETKEQLLNRFHLSEFYHEKRGPKEITRYTDKYQKQKPTESFEPDFSRLPNELNWKDQAARRRAKTRKLNETSLEEKIAKLEKKESTNNDNEEADTKKADEGEESDTEQQRPKDDDEELSDEDYLEEDNDYVQNYFDNGEGMGNSDDELEDTNIF